jgi:hypothetical protein
MRWRIAALLALFAVTSFRLLAVLPAPDRLGEQPDLRIARESWTLVLIATTARADDDSEAGMRNTAMCRNLAVAARIPLRRKFLPVLSADPPRPASHDARDHHRGERHSDYSLIGVRLRQERHLDQRRQPQTDPKVTADATPGDQPFGRSTHPSPPRSFPGHGNRGHQEARHRP